MHCIGDDDDDDNDGGDDDGDDGDDDGGELSLPADWSLEAKNRSAWSHF